MKEKIVYRNELNEIPLSGFSASELNLFFLVCSRVKDKGCEDLTFDYGSLKKTLGLDRKADKRFTDEIIKVSVKLKKLTFVLRDEEGNFSVFSLFDTFEGIANKRVLEVTVNKKYAYLLNNVANNFTQFEFIEYMKLESKYSKNLYRILKQYRKSGICYNFKSDMGKLREMLDCPVGYPNKIFVRDCVNVALKELGSCFKELKAIPERGGGRGRPILGYTFTFTPEEDTVKPQTTRKDERPQKKEPAKNRFNNFPQRVYDYDDLERRILEQ